MAPKEKQKIEIEKTHRDPLLSFNQAVTVDCSDFLGTALIEDIEAALIELVHTNPLLEQAGIEVTELSAGRIEAKEIEKADEN
jgi:hypothetical protein